MRLAAFMPGTPETPPPGCEPAPARKSPSTGGYDTPVEGLWLAGAGSHPGGGVSGVPGMNAARRILAVER